MTKDTSWLSIANHMLIGEVRNIMIGHQSRDYRSYHLSKLKPRVFRSRLIDGGFKITRIS